MLSNAVYFATARVAGCVENWLVEIDNSVGGTLRLAFADCYVGGNFYHGAITNKPSIRSSIDLAQSRAGTGSLTLEVANFVAAGVPLSQVLMFAATGYLNREVRVYSQLNGQETLANCLQIWTGRLTSVTHDAHTVRLECEESRPWDFISVCTVKGGTRGLYFPVVYGDFTPNASTPDTPAYCPGKALWPGEVDRAVSDGLHVLMPQSYSDDSIRAHFYEPAADHFVPLVEADGDYLDATVSSGSGNELVVGPDLIHAWKLKPVDHSSHLVWPSTLTDPELSYDDDDADEATTYGYASVNGTAHTINYSVPNVALDIYDTVDEVVQLKVYIRYYSARSTSPYGPINLLAGSTTVATYTPTTSPETGTIEFVVDASDLPGGVMPSTFGLQFTGGSVPAPITVRVYDFRLSIITRTAPGTDAASVNRAKDQQQDVERLYFGADGLTRSWTTGAVTEIHEMHRDLLYRFAGYTDTPGGWSALDTARSGWECRWWAHEPVLLSDLLEQVQYEGGFIFQWQPDGTASYLFVASSYSSGDVDVTLSEDDIAGLSVGHTDLGGLVTKKQIRYERHPATGDYRSTYTYTNSTARTAYNIQTEENIEEVELDALTASVSSHASYYGGINGTIKATVSFRLLNRVYFGLQPGDIVQFDASAMSVRAHSVAWTQYFMVTDCQRRAGEMRVTCVEVG